MKIKPVNLKAEADCGHVHIFNRGPETRLENRICIPAGSAGADPGHFGHSHAACLRSQKAGAAVFLTLGFAI